MRFFYIGILFKIYSLRESVFRHYKNPLRFFVLIGTKKGESLISPHSLFFIEFKNSI
jgi:hypothetical protein